MPRRSMRQVPSAAGDVVAVDAAPDERPGAGPEERAQGLGISRRDHVAEDATRNAADDQARGSVAAPAIVAIVGAAIDAVVPAEPPRLVFAVVVPIVPRGVVAPLTWLEVLVIVLAPLALHRPIVIPSILVRSRR